MTEADLLRAVLWDPADDLARLALADWWEEQGQDERAEFVRLGLELHGLSARPIQDTFSARQRVALRMAALLAAHHWFSLPRGCSWDTSRAFVHHIALPCADFLAHAGAIFAAHPITEVRLSDREPVPWPRPIGPDHWEWVVRAASYKDQAPAGLPHRVTHLLFGLLAGGELLFYGGVRSYPSEQEAHDDLSRACVRYGRALVGLPELPGA